jgi:hypothetical protein
MDAALQINPYYGKTSTAGILAHFAAVLDYGRVGLSTALHSLTPRAPSSPGSSSHLFLRTQLCYTFGQRPGSWRFIHLTPSYVWTAARTRTCALNDANDV